MAPDTHRLPMLLPWDHHVRNTDKLWVVNTASRNKFQTPTILQSRCQGQLASQAPILGQWISSAANGHLILCCIRLWIYQEMTLCQVTPSLGYHLLCSLVQLVHISKPTFSGYRANRLQHSVGVYTACTDIVAVFLRHTVYQKCMENCSISVQNSVLKVYEKYSKSV